MITKGKSINHKWAKSAVCGIASTVCIQKSVAQLVFLGPSLIITIIIIIMTLFKEEAQDVTNVHVRAF